MTESDVVSSARVLWEYLSSFRQEQPADAIVVCGSYDLRVMDHAIKLLEKGLSGTLVISGNSGNWTKHLWQRPEARIFYDHSKPKIPNRVRIILEEKATNFGENIQFSKQLLPGQSTILLLTKPNAILRVLLTARKQWPESTCSVSSPEYKFPDDVSNIVGLFGLINEMVGDIDRIERYPSYGFQVEHELPEFVKVATDHLIEAGFDQHLSANTRSK